MRIGNPVLFSLSLSLLSFTGSFTSPGPADRALGGCEPLGDLGAAAALVAVTGASGSPRATVLLSLLSPSTDAEASVAALEGEGPSGSLRPLARVALAKGRRHSLLLESDLAPGSENHLFYRVTAQGRDGSSAETTVYLRVNLDPSREPELVGDYLEYRGAPAEEGRP